MGDNDKVGLRHVVPGVFNGIATALTAAAGLIGVLYQTGYIGTRTHLRLGAAARASAEMQMRDESEQLAAVASPAAHRPPINGGDVGAAPVAAPRPRNLSGAWRDGASNCHLIKQVGHTLTVSSYFAAKHLWAVGNGTVKGRVIAVKMNSANPASPEANLVLSDDGHELSGMMKGVNGAHVATWRFVGPSCVQTAASP